MNTFLELLVTHSGVIYPLLGLLYEPRVFAASCREAERWEGLEMKLRSFWYSAMNVCRIPFYVPAVRDEERRPVYFKYLLDFTSILDITLPVLPSHYQPSTAFTSSRSPTSTPRPSSHPYTSAHMYTFAQSSTVPKLTLTFAVVPFGGRQVLWDVHVWLYTLHPTCSPLLVLCLTPSAALPT